MPTITNWDSSFSVGSDLLDRQHQKLFKLCKLLGEVISGTFEDQQQDFHEILHELAEYSRVHFDTEESLLRKAGYGDLHLQLAEHIDYCRQIAEVTYRAATAGQVDRIEIQRFISKWWTEHILIEDMKFRTFLVAETFT